MSTMHSAASVAAPTELTVHQVLEVNAIHKLSAKVKSLCIFSKSINAVIPINIM
jgi:hypothetical protein